MKERPILFSGAMVKAILDGRKTMTRLVMTPQPSHYCDSDKCWVWKGYSWNEDVHKPNCRIDWRGEEKPVPYYEGLKLWVRETWHPHKSHSGPASYRATWDDDDPDEGWKPSIFMPRWASRITLEIVSVRVERVQDITEEDAKAEGCYREDWRETISNPMGEHGRLYSDGVVSRHHTHRNGFRRIWDSINAKRGFGWDINPWVLVIEFKRV
jgi:hypothetical protein